MKKKELKKLLKKLTKKKDPGKPLSDWISVHKKQILEKGYKLQTVRNRSILLAHIERIWGARPINGLRPHEITTDLRANFLPDRSATAQRVLCELKEVYSNAVANDWAENNPALHVKMPVHKVLRSRMTADVWSKSFEASKTMRNPWVSNMFLLALVTGQRRADLSKMKFSDIVDGCLCVEQQKQAGKGYGARVALPLGLRLDFLGMTVQDVIDKCRNTGTPGEFLLRKNNGQRIENSSLTIKFAESIRQALGKDAFSHEKWPSLHEVRSLSARLYIAQGLGRDAVQTLLGHKTAEMTAMYEDDRGLTASEYKRVKVA